MDILLILVNVTVFTLMLTIGINHSLGQLTALWREPGVLLRSLISVLVVVPVVAIILLWLFDLPPYIVTALAVLAAAPGAPMTTRRSQMAGADLTYVSTLQLTVSLLAVAVTPLILAIFYALFELTIEHVSPLEVASQVARVTFLPVVVGLVLQLAAPKLIAKARKPLNTLANILFLLLAFAIIVAIAVVPDLREGLGVGWAAYAAILILAVAAIVSGHLLGGQRLDRRAGLATATLARNAGLAVFILGLTESGYPSIPVVVVYMLLGSVTALPYGIWIKRRISSNHLEE